MVWAKLEQDWSPEQIARWLRRQHPTDPGRWESHETIYRSLYITSRGGVDQDCPCASCSPSRAPVKKSMSENGARSPRQSPRIRCASAAADSLRGNSASS